MIQRGAIQERMEASTGTTAYTSTTHVKNLPKHHRSLMTQTTKTIDQNDRLQCNRPAVLNRTVLLMFLVSSQLISMSYTTEDGLWQRQLSSEFLDSIPISRAINAMKPYDSYHIRNKNSFRQPRVLHVDPQFYTIQDTTSYEEEPSEKSEREVHVPKRERRAKRRLENSRQYSHWQRDPLREGDCEPMKPWQETSFPSCNKIHEMHMHIQFEVLTNGGYNTVFKMTDNDGSNHIVKILKYSKDYTDRNLDRVRRDSLIMERATKSDYVMNTYSYCGFSQIIEYGQGGDLFAWIYSVYDHFSQNQKLQIASQVAQALADVHNLEGNGISSMTHGDFASKQYILVDGIFKLSDFNRGRFIRWNKKVQEPCPYTIGYNDGKFRSPEEYKYIPETAAIDVWALGSIFIELVSGRKVWHGYEDEAARKAISNGIIPSFREHMKNPSDPINQVLMKAIDMCYVYDPKDRPKAGVVADYLKNESKRLGVAWNKPFVLQ